MKWKSISLPKMPEGLSFVGVEDQTVPDQSMSLEEILQRFTRGESLDIAQIVNWGSPDDNPLNVDLEKLAMSDLVDKAEFSEKLRDVQKKYDLQEKVKQTEAQKLANEKAKKAEEKRIRIAAQKLAKQSSGGKA